MEPQVAVCDVCLILDKDATPKPCGYCGGCGAWICEKDVMDLQRRAKAMARKKVADFKKMVGVR